MNWDADMIKCEDVWGSIDRKSKLGVPPIHHHARWMPIETTWCVWKINHHVGGQENLNPTKKVEWGKAKHPEQRLTIHPHTATIKCCPFYFHKRSQTKAFESTLSVLRSLYYYTKLIVQIAVKGFWLKTEPFQVVPRLLGKRTLLPAEESKWKAYRAFSLPWQYSCVGSKFE